MRADLDPRLEILTERIIGGALSAKRKHMGVYFRGLLPMTRAVAFCSTPSVFIRGYPCPSVLRSTLSVSTLPKQTLSAVPSVLRDRRLRATRMNTDAALARRSRMDTDGIQAKQRSYPYAR